MKKAAAIDIGSMTARLLVAEQAATEGMFRTISRGRGYIRLGEGFEEPEKATIKPDAIERTLNVLGDFVSITEASQVDSMRAVATGVLRAARNGEYFKKVIMDRTGIAIHIISGEEEAGLTAKGVLHFLDIGDFPYTIFDLGGGTTEFIFNHGKKQIIKSLPLGSLLLKQSFLSSVPPDEKGISSLSTHVDGVLDRAFKSRAHSKGQSVLIGTGGTVTTLAAMMHDIIIQDIRSERMNGLIIKQDGLERLITELQGKNLEDILKMPGLDTGRADVILAGAIIVNRVLTHFQSVQIVVSLSDI